VNLDSHVQVGRVAARYTAAQHRFGEIDRHLVVAALSRCENTLPVLVRWIRDSTKDQQPRRIVIIRVIKRNLAAVGRRATQNIRLILIIAAMLKAAVTKLGYKQRIQ